MDIFGTLKQKFYGVPVYVWALGGIMGLALYLKRKKSTNSSDQAAADQTNSNLGSAGQLSNQFWVAGLMPYQGGDVYVTQTNTAVGATPGSGGKTSLPGQISGPPTAKPPARKPTPVAKPSNPIPSQVDYAYKVKKGDTLSAIAKRYGLTVDQLWNYNVGTNPKNSAMRPSSTIATLKSRGKNLLYANETIDIPKKGTVYAGGY